jgi:hypothetical protein
MLAERTAAPWAALSVGPTVAQRVVKTVAQTGLLRAVPSVGRWGVRSAAWTGKTSAAQTAEHLVPRWAAE